MPVSQYFLALWLISHFNLWPCMWLAASQGSWWWLQCAAFVLVTAFLSSHHVHFYVLAMEFEMTIVCVCVSVCSGVRVGECTASVISVQCYVVMASHIPHHIGGTHGRGEKVHTCTPLPALLGLKWEHRGLSPQSDVLIFIRGN